MVQFKTSLAEFFKIGYGSKRAVLPMMMKNFRSLEL
jgi:hypothetical protein